MLELLHIKNVAVIERADVEFGPGLNVLTGETGAGKSIIIDAIGAILGERASRELVRHGAAAAFISAQLTPSEAAERWLIAGELPYEEGESLVISRRVGADGKSACRVNGAPVSAAQLRELGELLFDVHGQNDGRRLLSEASHRRYLDAFGGLEAICTRYRESYTAYTEKRKALAALKQTEADKERREELLVREIEELRGADPQEGEAALLAERAKRLKNAQKLTQHLTRAQLCFHGDEGDGVLSRLQTAEAALDAAVRVAASLGELARALGDLRYQAEDVSEQIDEVLRDLEDQPGELDRIESRLSLLQRLERRYGSAEAAQLRLKAAEDELEDVQYLTERLETLSAETRRAREALLESGRALTEARKLAANRLEEAVIRELRDLNMAGIRFQADFSPKSGEGFDATGMDDVRFLMSANAGEALGRLSHIASGGELSRIMLAMKNVLREASEAEILIFDEIDTGVSGVAAQRVGEKLAALAGSRQILCVTHLPQLAAMADTQFSIVKRQEDGRTYTDVLALDEAGRKRELARLIGGETVTETTLSGAGELIAAARAYKQQKRNEEHDSV